MRSCCYGVYERLPDGRWVYPWGEDVPGARDLTVRDVLRLRAVGEAAPLPHERAHHDVMDDPIVDPPDGGHARPDDPDRVLGMSAPELHVRAMLTLADIAAMLGVTQDTVAAYRYRGYLPEPQAVIGRTPLWARPIMWHWAEHRPGNGWRSDIYGDRAEYAEWLRHRRAARLARRSR